MKKAIIIFVLILAKLNLAFAADRPKIGLVLSGGGARGAAHIGVIEALEEMQIPIDCIVGTSMGAVIGGLYASGVPIEKIKKDFLAMDWDGIFEHDIFRENLYYRRKRDQDLFMIKNLIRISNGSFQLSSGLTSGETLYETFNAYILPVEPFENFCTLKIPFKAIATDLISSNVAVLEQGDLALALVSSMAVPGLIAPIPMEQFLLVDGGVSDNLPIAVAKKMGADIVIAVNVSTPLFDRNQVNNFVNILVQITNILTNSNTVRSEHSLTSRDIYILPDLNNLSTSDFHKFKKGIRMGRDAAFAKAQALEKLVSPASVTPPEEVAMICPLDITQEKIKSEGVLSKETYVDYLQFDAPPTTEEITDSINKLYGLSIFEHVYYGIEEEAGERTLVVEAKSYPQDTILVQASLQVEADSQSNDDFSFVLGFTDQQVNAWLGEWRIIGSIGQNTGLFGEFYQPLAPSLRWFVNPYTSVNRTPVVAYYNFDEVSTYVATVGQAGISAGYVFSTWGQLRGFYEYDDYDFKRRTGPDFPIFEGHRKDVRLGGVFEWDTVDNLFFPHHGMKGDITFTTNDKRLDDNRHFEQLTIQAYVAGTMGRHTLATGGMYNTTFKGQADYQSQFFLGGIFQLSGLVNYEIEGDNSALYDAVYFYRVPKKLVFTHIYVGASLEAGRVWRNTNLSDDSLIGAGSVFIGLDTFIGPIYLVLGATDDGKKAAHFAIRPFFRSDFTQG